MIVVIGAAPNPTPTPIAGTELLVPLLPLTGYVDSFVTDAFGELQLPFYGGGNTPTSSWVFQAATFDGTSYDLSNALEVVVGAF